MADFFPIDDVILKELSFVPFEEYLCRGDFRCGLYKSRYYYPRRENQKGTHSERPDSSLPNRNDGEIRRSLRLLTDMDKRNVWGTNHVRDWESPFSTGAKIGAHRDTEINGGGNPASPGTYFLNVILLWGIEKRVSLKDGRSIFMRQIFL